MAKKFDDLSYVQFGYTVDPKQLNAQEWWSLIHQTFHRLLGMSTELPATVPPAALQYPGLWGQRFHLDESEPPIEVIPEVFEKDYSYTLSKETPLLPLCPISQFYRCGNYNNLSGWRRNVLHEEFLLICQEHPFIFVKLSRCLKRDNTLPLWGRKIQVDHLTFSNISKEEVLCTVGKGPEIGLGILRGVTRLIGYAAEERLNEAKVYNEMASHMKTIGERLQGF